MFSVDTKLCLHFVIAWILVPRGVPALESGCVIPNDLHGKFYSKDRNPDLQVIINASHVTLLSFSDLDMTSQTGQTAYQCVQHNTSVVADRLVWANLWMQNQETQEFKCYAIDVLTENGNAQRWKETRIFSGEEYLSEVCEKLHDYRGHSPQTTDGDYHYRWDATASVCDEPFNSTLHFTYKAPVIAGEEQKPPCVSHANQVTPTTDEQMDVHWAACPDTPGIAIDGRNFTRTCLGSWMTDGVITHLMEKAGYSTQQDKYTCMWSAPSDPFELHLALALEDCSMIQQQRRASIILDVETETDGVGRHAACTLWLLACLVLLCQII